MTRKALLTIAVACIAITLFRAGEAQAPKAGTNAITLLIDGDGDYLVQVRNGVATVIPTTVVEVDPTPVDPVDPQPELNERATKFREATLTVEEPDRNETAAALAEGYRMAGQMILDNNVSDYPKVAGIVSDTENFILNRQKVVEEWKPVTDLRKDELAKLGQEGATASQYADCLNDASDGIDSTTPEQLDPIWIELLMQILKLILEKWLDLDALPVTP